MTFAGIYARSSLGKEKQGDTVEHQIAMIKEFAKRANLEVMFDEKFIYDDDDQSGYKTTLLQRPAMRRLLSDIDNGVVTTVFFKGISRFARDSGEAITTAKKLSNKGVRVLSLEENYDSSRDEPTMFQIYAVMAEQESRKTSIRVSLGNKQKARNGDWPGSSTPFGLTKVCRLSDEILRNNLIKQGRRPQSLHPDQHADTVRKIFNLFLNENMGRKRIVSTLNELGYRHKNGVLFQEKHIVDILTNEAYIGNVVYGKTRYNYVEDDGRNKKVQQTIKISECDWIRTENAHPAIIEREVFDLAQKKINDNKTRYNQPQKFNAAKHPLTGLLKCGSCGGNMICQKRSNKRKDGTKIEYRYYVCSTYHKMGRTVCSQANVNADHLEEDIFKFIYKKLEQFNDLNISEETREKDNKKEELLINLNQIDMQISKKINASKALLESRELYDLDTFVILNKEYQDEIKKLRNQKSELEEAIQKLNDNQSDIELTQLYNEFQDKNKLADPAYRRLIFHKLLEEVVLMENEVKEISFTSPLLL